MNFKQKFKIGDFVKTNIHYCVGWQNHPAPRDIRRIFKGEVVGVSGNGEGCENGKGEGWLYEVKTKSQVKLINQCFLEKL
jgi:hypothetical protein